MSILTVTVIATYFITGKADNDTDSDSYQDFEYDDYDFEYDVYEDSDEFGELPEDAFDDDTKECMPPPPPPPDEYYPYSERARRRQSQRRRQAAQERKQNSRTQNGNQASQTGNKGSSGNKMERMRMLPTNKCQDYHSSVKELMKGKWSSAVSECENQNEKGKCRWNKLMALMQDEMTETPTKACLQQVEEFYDVKCRDP